MKFSQAFCLWIALYLPMVCAAAEPAPLLLGVLEEPQCKPDKGLIVRPLFAKAKGGWVSLDKPVFAQKMAFDGMKWQAGLDGRALGAITTRSPGFQGPEWTYPRDFLLGVSDERVPKVGNRNKDFGGWCDPPARRPLIVTSGNRLADPEGWRRIEQGLPSRKDVFSALKRVWARKKWCRNTDSGKPEVQQLDAARLDIGAVYRDNSGRQLLQISLPPYLYECSAENDEGGTSHWLLLGAEPAYLGNMDSLVDAADYDNDGVTEFIFWSGGYNRDGYVLYKDAFKNRIDFLWNYH